MAAGATFAPAPGIAAPSVGLSTWLEPNLDSLPLYAADADDPHVRVLYSPDAWSKVAQGLWRRSGNRPGVEAQILGGAQASFPHPGNVYSSQSATGWVLPVSYDRLVNPKRPPAYARVPRGARPAPGTDGHLAVRQLDGRVLETYGAIRLSSGDIVALNYHVTDSAGSGDGYQNGVTASMVPVYAGVITEAEVEAGRIDHAVKLLAPAALLAPWFTYPALAIDRGALSDDPPYGGALPMGARLAIPPRVNPADLGLTTRLGRMIAAAAKTYGFIITDRGGGGITIAVEQDVRDPALDRWSWGADRDLHEIMRNVRLVVPNGSQP